MKKFIAALLTVLMILSLTSCGNKTTDEVYPDTDTVSEVNQETVEINVTLSPRISCAPFYIAKELGYFEKYGFSVNLNVIDDITAHDTALDPFYLQGVCQTLDRNFVMLDGGTPLKYVCTLANSNGGDGLFAAADITDIEDLAGRTVALDKSSASYLLLLQALTTGNITEDQLTIVDISNDEAANEFLAGTVDAAVVWGKAFTKCSNHDGGHLLISSAEYPMTIIDTLVVSQAFAEQYPDAVNALRSGWYMAIEFLTADYAQGCEIMANGLGIGVSEVIDECSGISFFNKAKDIQFRSRESEQNLFTVASGLSGLLLEKGYIQGSDFGDFF